MHFETLLKMMLTLFQHFLFFDDKAPRRKEPKQFLIQYVNCFSPCRALAKIHNFGGNQALPFFSFEFHHQRNVILFPNFN